MSLILGMDTGGTYTDAVIVDADSKEIRCKAKALTTKEELKTASETWIFLILKKSGWFPFPLRLQRMQSLRDGAEMWGCCILERIKSIKCRQTITRLLKGVLI